MASRRPVQITLINGEKRYFRLTMVGITRIKDRFNVATFKELLDKDITDTAVPILYEAMLGKTERPLTKPQLEALLPATFYQESIVVIHKLLGLAPLPRQRVRG